MSDKRENVNHDAMLSSVLSTNSVSFFAFHSQYYNYFGENLLSGRYLRNINLHRRIQRMSKLDRKLTKHTVSNALRRCGNISAAARMLDVTRCTVQRAIKRYELVWPVDVRRDDAPQINSANESDALADDPIAIQYFPESSSKSQRRLDLSAFSGQSVGDVGARRR